MVTRREFYGALVVIWLYFMIVMTQMLDADAAWARWILWVASLVITLMYTILLIRSAATSKSQDKSA